MDSALNWDIWLSASMRELGVQIPIIVKKELTSGSVQLPTCRHLVAFEWPQGISPGLQMILQKGLGLPYLLHHSWSRLSQPPWGISGGSRHWDTSSSPQYSAMCFGRSKVRPQVHTHRYLFLMLDKICSPLELLLNSSRSNMLASPGIFPPHAPVLYWLISSWQKKVLVSGSNMDFLPVSKRTVHLALPLGIKWCKEMGHKYCLFYNWAMISFVG